MTNKLTEKQEEDVKNFSNSVMREHLEERKIDLKTAKKHLSFLYKNFLDEDIPKVKIVSGINEIVDDVEDHTRKEVIDNIYYTSFDANWLAYYFCGVDYLKEEISQDKKENEELKNLLYKTFELNKYFYAICPFENVCYVIRNKKIMIKDDDLELFHLHNENGKAIEHMDGNGLYFLNNVSVPNYIVETPAESLNIDQVLAERDVDTRREGLNKIGVDRIYAEKKGILLDSTSGVEKWEEYELIEFDFGDKKRKFLKMFDTSVDRFCLERTDDSCQTVRDARAFQDGESIDKYKEPKEYR